MTRIGKRTTKMCRIGSLLVIAATAMVAAAIGRARASSLCTFTQASAGGGQLQVLVAQLRKHAPLPVRTTLEFSDTQPVRTTLRSSQSQREATPFENSNIQVTADATSQQLPLVEVQRRASAFSTSLVVTSGTVAGVRTTPPCQLLLTDNAGNYLVVTVPHALEEQIRPTLETLAVGDAVEVAGIPGIVSGELVKTPNGLLLESVGVNLGRAPTFGSISPTWVKKK